jgi:hypothetical protein
LCTEMRQPLVLHCLPKPFSCIFMALIPRATKHSVKVVIDIARVSVVVAGVLAYPSPGIVEVLPPSPAFIVIRQQLFLVVGFQGVSVEVDEWFVCRVEDGANC